MSGPIGDDKIVALRIDSDIITWPQTQSGFTN